jgi:hypothetical protein
MPPYQYLGTLGLAELLAVILLAVVLVAIMVATARRWIYARDGVKAFALALVAVFAVLALAACGDTITNVNVDQSVTTPTTLAPSPAASASPGASGLVSKCTFGPFGAEAPAGKTKPPNGLRPYPLYLGGSAITTVTPRTPEGDPIFDVRVSGRFPDFAVLSGGDVVNLAVNLGSNSDGYNADLLPLKAGSARVQATVRPPGGAPVSCDFDVVVS